MAIADRLKSRVFSSRVHMYVCLCTAKKIVEFLQYGSVFYRTNDITDDDDEVLLLLRPLLNSLGRAAPSRRENSLMLQDYSRVFLLLLRCRRRRRFDVHWSSLCSVWDASSTENSSRGFRALAVLPWRFRHLGEQRWK